MSTIVKQVTAAPIYSDRAGSKLDVAGLHTNQELIAPLRAFDKQLTALVDGSNHTQANVDLECAHVMLLEWAEGQALQTEPDGFPAVRERQRFSLGIFIAAAKLQARGVKLEPVIREWLGELSAAIIRDFASRGIVDNLYVWSGVDAAAVALVTHRQDALTYASEVWDSALKQIDSRGLLPSELRRQSRALLYHQYYLSGLLFLKQARGALGAHVSAAEITRLKLLAEQVHGSMCNPELMRQASGGFTQEPVPGVQLGIDAVFGAEISDQHWKDCSQPVAGMNDETLGGDLENTLNLLQRDAFRG